MDHHVAAQKNPYAQDQSQMLDDFVALYDQLAPLPLHQPGRVTAFGWDLEYVSGPALTANIQYQVIRRINDFFTENEAPVILDMGANIGISVLNYKRQYPNAKIIAFEPDVQFIPTLRRNLANNGASDVEVVDAAVWIADGQADWFSEGIDGSHLVSVIPGEVGTGAVRTVDIARYLDQDIDLIKMDIEGAESTILPYLTGKLNRVKNLSIECHVMTGEIEKFADLLKTLETEGFSVWISSYNEWQDLIRVKKSQPNHFDQYFVVSASREKLTPRALAWGVPPNADLGMITGSQQCERLLAQTNDLYHQLYDQHQALWRSYEELQKQLETQRLETPNTTVTAPSQSQSALRSLAAKTKDALTRRNARKSSKGN